MNGKRASSRPEPLVSRSTYLAVCAALLLLSGLSILLAQLSLGGWNTVLVLVIAGGQAFLITQYYMRLHYTAGMPWLAALAGLFWFSLLLVGTLDDVLTRGSFPGR